MNTNQLKKFAQSARTKLIDHVGAKLEFVLHMDSAELREKTDSLKQLQVAINATSKAQVIDKVAYTWFNRFMALRFMDANNYQPTGIRVITPKNGYTLPEILEEAKRGFIPEDLLVDRNHIYDILDGKKPSASPQNEAYKELLIGSCNHLNKTFPFLFERINDYTELLMPDDLISQYSILQDVRDGMAEEDCYEVEIIGWLYQFYISEKKDEVFASKKSVKKEDIPAATQLFTPRWIVEYMVQNTVGKLWLQNKPKSRIREYMPYYIESASSTATDYLHLNSIEELKLLDQACGSGHILVYGFELLYKIYEEEGYNPSDIPQLIIEKNLYGFEIDERAAQLAGMAIMMKARSYNRRFFRKGVEPNILCYSDLKLSEEEVTETFHELEIDLPDSLKFDLNLIKQATNLGSLIHPKTSIAVLKSTLATLENKLQTANLFLQPKTQALRVAIIQLIPLGETYHCVVDNPPYMGSGNMNKELSDFVKTNYPDSKADLMACFMEAGLAALQQKGFLGMINQHSWMFLSSYEKLRTKLIEKIQFDTLLHLGSRTFPEIGGEVVQNASFTLLNTTSQSKGSYLRLVDFENSELKRDKTLEAIQNPRCGWFYTANQNDFEKIPGSLIAYWVSDTLRNVFDNKQLKDYGSSCIGMRTGDNLHFLRYWHEIKISIMGVGFSSSQEAQEMSMKWIPYCKGGSFRKWYGNNDYVVNWESDGYEIKENTRKVYPQLGENLGWKISNEQFYFKSGLTWSGVAANIFGVRYYPIGMIFDSGANSYFVDNTDYKLYIAGLLNSNIINNLIKIINPTINTGSGVIAILPAIVKERYIESINIIVNNNILLSTNDWDSREASWNFKTSPLFDALLGDIGMYNSQFVKSRIASRIKDGLSLQDAFNEYLAIRRNMFFQLHQNEEELNRQFIEIYGLQEELTPDVPLEEITILKEETSIENGELVFHADEVIAQFVSYAVGCMFGRYSLDMAGLILANQGETLQDYLEKVGKSNAELTFVPDDDNIIPILDEEWFEDDITSRFYEFLKASFGKENFEKNLAFVEESLGMDVRKYFTKNFYADHIKRYKKRPIYWMFSSPKGSFNVLIYMHRYTPNTLSKILNGYLREFKAKIGAYIEHLEQIKNTGTSTESAKASSRIDKLKQVLLELQEYERDILYPLATERIAIDLDDGVLVNYNKFGRAIKEVAGLNDKVAKKKVKDFDWINSEEIR